MKLPVDSHHLYPCASIAATERAELMAVDLRENWWECTKAFLIPNRKLPIGIILDWITGRSAWASHVSWQTGKRRKAAIAVSRHAVEAWNLFTTHTLTSCCQWSLMCEHWYFSSSRTGEADIITKWIVESARFWVKLKVSHLLTLWFGEY